MSLLIVDEFPLMPTRKCPDCDAPKKLMFFAKQGTYCREHARARDKEKWQRSTAPVDRGFEFNRQPIGTGRAG
jgi:hypothetical protein